MDPCTHRPYIGRQALRRTWRRSYTRIGVARNELLGGDTTGENLNLSPPPEG